MANVGLWVFFILFAVVAIATLLYAIQALGPTRDVEKRVLDLQDQIEDEEA